MLIGGVFLVAGMILNIADGDYLYGQGRVCLNVRAVIERRHEAGADWVIITGREKVADGPWRDRRVQLKVAALKRSQVMGESALA